MKVPPTVSLCLITKNEEDCITACIESVRNLVTEIVLVDTGSTDKTMALARKFNARIVSYSWQEDFAAARNFGLDQAKGDWILVLDADEVLEPIEPDRFFRLLTVSDVEGYFFTIRSLLGSGDLEVSDQVVRLFRNNPLYRFEGFIHEQVVASIQRHSGGSALVPSEIAIFHSGYLQEKITVKNKHQRNIRVIQQALTANPNDPFLLYSLGIEVTQTGDLLHGNQFLAAALERLTGREGYFHHVITTLGMGWFEAGDREQLDRLLDKAFIMFPGDPELCLLKGLRALQVQNWQAAAKYLEQATHAETENLLPFYFTQALLGDALQAMGKYRQAENSYAEAARLAPGWSYPREQMQKLGQNKSNP